MQNNIYTKIAFGVLFICLNAVAVFASDIELTNRVTRAATLAQLQLAENSYKVEISLHWKKEVTLGDMMLREPRRPAHKEQIMRTEQKETFCQGVLTNEGQQVLMPASCLREGKYKLDALTLQFQNGCRILKQGHEVILQGEIARLDVPANITAGLFAIPAETIPEGQGLQDWYGAEMTKHLRSFFHAKNVGPLGRTRLKISTAKQRTLQVGDALIYQGKVVALVKKVVPGYADRFGGVSESAFALIR